MAEEIKFRLEHDSIGEKEVPIDAYYGVQTLRASENFFITGLTMHPELINSVAQIKKADRQEKCLWSADPRLPC